MSERDSGPSSPSASSGMLDASRPSPWSRADAMKLYRALSSLIPDAVILADAKGTILATNGNAAEIFHTSADGLVGSDCQCLFSPRDRALFSKAFAALEDDGFWAGDLEAMAAGAVPADPSECFYFPVSVNIHRVRLSEDAVLQVVIRDMSVHVEMEEHLQRKEAVVEGMNLALRHVIRSVHEERREMKDELVQQVKEQVLPTLERIAEEERPDVRHNYKSVIEDQLGEMTEGTADPLDSVFIRLTQREVEICRLIALGRKTREICELLHISFETMQTHRKNIRRKLGLKGRRVSLYVYLQQQATGR